MRWLLSTLLPLALAEPIMIMNFPPPPPKAPGMPPPPALFPPPPPPAAPAFAPPMSLRDVAAGDASGDFQGEATFVTAPNMGACSYQGYTLPPSIFGTGASDTEWANSEACGGCVSVTGPNGNKITAMIVDESAGSGKNHLDMFPDTFEQLAPKSKGVVPISWSWTKCPITAPLVIQIKTGVSAYWFSAQVRNATERTAKLEVSTDGGKTWKATARKTFNYFDISGGTQTQQVDVRVTSVSGKVVTVKNVPCKGPAEIKASGNY